MAKTPTGTDVYIKYGYEAVDEGTEAASIDQAFGFDTRINPNSTNQLQRVYDLNSQDAQKLVSVGYSGTVEVSFALTTPYWLKSIIGGVADAGGPLYTHTYTPANSTTTITIEDGTDIDTDIVRKYLGCRATTMKLNSAPNDTIKCTLTYEYLNETKGTTLSTAATPADDPFTFANATVELPTANSVTDVESWDLTVARNVIRVPTQGSRFSAKTLNTARDYTMSLTVPKEATTTLLDRHLGGTTAPSTGTPAEQATAQITITNGDTTPATDERKLEINLANLGVDTFNDPAAPNEIRNETATLFARTLTSMVWSDETAVAP